MVSTIFLMTCHSSGSSHKDSSSSNLAITYTGEGAVVQFKMVEGLHRILTRDTSLNSFQSDLYIENLDDAIFSYDLLVHKKDTSGKMMPISPIVDSISINNEKPTVKQSRFIWIGKNRNPDYHTSETIVGTLTTKKIDSQYLSESREITVYEPITESKNIPHVYFTDGQVVRYYASYVDRLISDRRIAPVKLIGVHSSPADRYEEYVFKSESSKLFDKHLDFFLNEVIEESNLEHNSKKTNKYLYGFSNGGSFCIYVGLNFPDKFREVIAFSSVDYISEYAQKSNPIQFEFTEYPYFYLGAGIYEKSIFADNLYFHKKIKDNQIESELHKFISGHDSNVWRIEFLDYLVKEFGK